MEYLGSYGNADPLDVSQWVELPFSSSADTASWDDERCAAFTFSLHVSKGFGMEECVELPILTIVPVRRTFVSFLVLTSGYAAT